MTCIVGQYLKSCLKHLSANKYLLFLGLLLCPALAMAQDCVCTNCPGTIPAGPTTLDFEFDIDGALINDLSNPFQGVCGVTIDFRHSFIWKVEMVLTSPGGQSVSLIGPNIDPPLGSFTGFANWDILFLPCGDPVSPDAGFSAIWDNDQTWQTGGQYSGSYYPLSGCLQDFDMGSVNGTWTLSVTNSHGLYTGLIRDFSVLFCNDLGLNCFTCEADAGDWSSIPNEEFCQADSLLNLTIEPKYNPDPPDPTIYDYQFIIAQSDIILAIDSFPDLRLYDGGTYEICGLSFLAEDSLSLPTPNGFSNVSDLRDELNSLTPDFCGQVSTDCIEVVILPTRSMLRDTICEGEIYWFGGIPADTTGLYRDTLNSSFNCPDSVVTLDLLVLDTTLIQVNEVFCEGEIYTYRGVDYTTTGLTIIQFPIANSDCDTTVVLDLVFNTAVNETVVDTICEGESFDFAGSTYDMTGEYIVVLPAAQGNCDTTMTLQLTVIDSIITNLVETICEGEEWTIGMETFSTSGNYEVLLPAAQSNCDSIIRLNLTVADSIITNLIDTICFGESYEVGTESFEMTGNYQVAFDLPTACDSFVILNLTVLDQIETNLVETICNGANYSVGDSIFTETGMYDVVFVSQQNCDSTVYLSLKVLEPIQTILQETICFGETFAVGDSLYSTMDLHTTTLSSFNDCDSIVVLDLVVLNPSAQILLPDTLNCTQNQFNLVGSAPGTIANVTYQWTHLDNGGTGIINGANTSTPLINRAGLYELIVTETYQNNACTAAATVTVNEDQTTPDLMLEGDTLTCLQTIAQLTATSSVENLNYQWSGPLSFGSTIANPTTTLSGNYQVTITAENGCTNVESVSVIDNTTAPDLTLSGDEITCNNPLAMLQSSSMTAGVTFAWTGPNAFTSAISNPMVSDSGTYVLLLTAPNGCTTQNSVWVTQDTDLAPFSIDSDTINCNNPTIQLMVNTTDLGLTYQWEGPATFVSTLPNPMVSVPGDYMLTLTANNGCEKDTMIEVVADLLTPQINLSVNDTIDCTTTAVQIEVLNPSVGMMYQWTGPNGFVSNLIQPLVEDGGTYDVTITATNGCTSETSIDVEEDAAIPSIQTFDDTLTCSQQLLTLNPIVVPAVPMASWTGPDGFTSNLLAPEINRPGIYELIVTATNGCTNMATTTIEIDTIQPVYNLLGDTINCSQTTAQLQVLNAAGNLNYLWTGPNGFQSMEQNPVVIFEGIYELNASAPNGCEQNQMTMVLLDTLRPVLNFESDTLDCTTPVFNLTVTTFTENVTYQWTGPNGFVSTLNNPAVSTAGTYHLTVTAPNFCTTNTTIEVIEDQMLPDLTLQADSITCDQPIAQLHSITSIADVIYNWAGPFDFVSNEANPMVTDAGNYSLTITANNGCTTVENIDVIANANLPDLDVIGGTLDCIADTLQLQSLSSIADLAYQWTGPAGFNSNLANPIIDQAGDYSLTITADNGCQAVAQTTVLQNNTPPDLQLIPDTLTCEENTIVLESISSTVDLTYSWAGPNGFGSNDAMPLINEAGNYSLTVTANNGCTNTAMVDIATDSDTPDLTLIGDTLNCIHTIAQLQSNSSASIVTYNWSGPGTFTSLEANPQVVTSGMYALTITAANGCTASETVVVLEDVISPTVQLSVTDSLDCLTTQVQITSQSSASGLLYSWVGPSGFISMDANPLVAEAGSYTVTVTGMNGCTNMAALTVEQDGAIPDLSIIGGELTCLVDTLILESQSTATDLTYSWTGPSGFSSTMMNPQIDQAGDYNLTITATNGCQAAAQTTVLENIDSPDLQMAVSDTLTCEADSLTLEGFSSTTDLTYNWTGPNGFNSMDTMPVIDEAGLYELTITANNGCINTASTEIIEDANVPDLNLIGDTLTCIETTAQLQSQTSATNVQYNWEGPQSYTSTTANPEVLLSGIYTLTITSSNGCSATSSVEVVEASDIPTIQLSVTDSLDCLTTQVQITSQSSTSGLLYSWAGPSGFISMDANPLVAEAGIYSVTITALNGCTNMAALTVEQDGAIPDLSIIGGELTCLVDTLILESQSTATDLTYSWTGPSGFSSTMMNPQIDEAGDYNLTITSTNGCQAAAQTTVLENIDPPDLQMIIADTLTCEADSLTLEGFSNTTNLAYHWIGPNGFNSMDMMPVIDEAGLYELTITANNGCTNTASTEIIEDASVPDLNLIGDTLTCIETTAQLQSQTSATNVQYHWEGPQSYTSITANPEVLLSGIYTLTITSPNGCSTSSSVEVVEASDIPAIQLSVMDSLDCLTTQVQITSQSSTGDLLYSWEGPSGFISMDANPLVAEAGSYSVTVTALNGCTNMAALTVEQDGAIPDVNIIGGTLTCLVDTLILESQSTATDLTYSWTGPSGFSSIMMNPEIDQAGDYSLTITSTNGCQAAAQTTVLENTTPPDLQMAAADTLTCETSSLTLEGFSSTTDLTYHWTGPNGFNSMDVMPMIDEVGMYQLTVTATNGCTTVATTTIIEQVEIPTVNIISDTLSCEEPSIMLQVMTSATGVAYQWSGPLGFSSNEMNPAVSEAGTYMLTITAANSCTATTSTEIIADASGPELSLMQPDTLDCNSTMIQLTSVTQTNDLTFAWTGPNNFMSTDPSPFVSSPGVYELTISAPNGCTNANALIVYQNGTLPSLTILGDTLDCITTSVQLLGQTDAIAANFSWNGPNSFTAVVSNPMVTQPGVYELTITAMNGCEQTGTYAVVADTLSPMVEIFTDTLSCQQTNIQLFALVEPNSGTYNWTGPDNFSSNEPTPIINTAGEYILTVTGTNGCMAIDSGFVEEDIAVPTVNLSVDTLTCLMDSIPIMLQTNEIDLLYQWLGPNGFSSNETMPQVGAAGMYQVTVTATNACTTTAAIEVIADANLPTVSLSADVLTCTNNVIEIETTVSTGEFLYDWSGPSNYMSEEQNPSVSLAGIYIVTITASNGCTIQEAIIIDQNNSLPIINLIGDTLDCSIGSTQLQLLDTQMDWTYQWEGPSGFNAIVADPVIELLGTYALTITAANGCTSEMSTTIDEAGGINDLLLSADTINCIQETVDLNAFTAVANIDYQWTGPNSFNSNLPNPVVAAGGIYTLTITASSGCTAIESVNVVVDTIAPIVTLTAATIDCNFPTTTLMTNTMNSGLTYQWTGPNSFSSALANPTVSEGGIYTLLSTALNGCTNIAETSVLMDTIRPDLSIVSDSISCTDPEASIVVSSLMSGLQYEWTGPNNFMADSTHLEVSLPGIYSVTVTAPNGCTRSEDVVIAEDESVPIAEAGTAEIITCFSPTVQLNGIGSSSGAAFAYQWLDPLGNPIGNELQLSVTDSGTYQLIVTNIQGGCEQTDEVIVEANTTPPVAVLVPINGLSINCNFSSLVLNANDSAPFGQVDFEWQQGNQSLSSSTEVEVSDVGTYLLIVMDQQNGCRDSNTVEIIEDTTLPTVSINEPTLLTCYDPEQTLNAENSSIGPIFNYQWSSATNGLVEGDTTLFPLINEGGIYQLVISNQQNGCVDSAQVEVLADQELPVAEAGPVGNLDCIITSIALDGSASSSGPIFTYQWSGPSVIENADGLNPTIDAAGWYTLEVSNQQNGCVATDEVLVIEDTDVPEGAFINLVSPSCYGQNNGQVIFDSVIGGMSPYLYAINGGFFNDYNQRNYLPAGDYLFTVQDAVGCEWDTLITLAEPPELWLDLGSDQPLELGDSVQLEVETNLDNNQLDTLIWSPVDYLTCTGCYDPVVHPLFELTYTATIIDQNGCTATDDVFIDLIKKRYVYIPNAFSPDNDGNNDLFTIYGGKDVELVLDFMVYNRWGATIFESHDFEPEDPAKSWDGTLDGKSLNPAVFVYYAKIKFIDGRIEEYSGDVTLIK